MFRLVSLNLNGIRSAAAKGFEAWAEGVGADCMGLQEIKCQADTVEDDAEDIALRARGAAAEDAMDDETELDLDDSTTDFVGLDTAPITVLGSRDFAGIRDDAPTDRPAGRTEEPPRRIRPPDGRTPEGGDDA